jgi:Holliday junction resolvase RusA-like endonuclease
VALRDAATEAMAGRAWYFGPVSVDLTIYSSSLKFRISDYFAGVEDTLDGCSGYEFTYLPIVFEDDSQVVTATVEKVESAEDRYEVKVTFL